MDQTSLWLAAAHHRDLVRESQGEPGSAAASIERLEHHLAEYGQQIEVLAKTQRSEKLVQAKQGEQRVRSERLDYGGFGLVIQAKQDCVAQGRSYRRVL